MKTVTDEELTARRKLWIEALRSGKYRQGTGALKKKVVGKPIKHCCLGVACEVYREQGLDLEATIRAIAPNESITDDPATWNPATWKLGDPVDEAPDDKDILFEFGGQCGVLPNEVAKWLGLWNTAGMPESGTFEVDNKSGTYASLADFNDRGAMFGEVADLLEGDLVDHEIFLSAVAWRNEYGYGGLK